MGYHLRAGVGAARRGGVRDFACARRNVSRVGSGHRYYIPELGRWLNRDPIEENAFALHTRISARYARSSNRRFYFEPEYVFVMNRPDSLFDHLGLISVTPSETVDDETAREIERVMQRGYSRYIRGIREPLQSAIRDLWPRYTFVIIDEDADGGSPCTDRTVLAYTQRGLLTRYLRRAPDGLPDQTATTVPYQITTGFICWCNIVRTQRRAALEWLGIHEVAHAAGWGSHYIDEEDPAFDNVAPARQDHPPGWGVPGAP